MNRTAVIAGYTGLVGGRVFGCMHSAGYRKVVLLRRRTTTAHPFSYVAPVRPNPPIVELRAVDFDRLTPADLAGADDVFCALGTTIKKAGSQDAFRKVDFDAIVNVARAAVEAGAKRLVLVSSVGADPNSKNFYLRVKGETEQAVAALPFDAVHIMRPGLLLGHRNESRPGERVAQAVVPMLNWLLAGSLRKYRAIAAETVARAMVAAAQSPATGVNTYQYDEIEGLTKRVRTNAG